MKPKVFAAIALTTLVLSSTALAHEKVSQDEVGDAAGWDIDSVRVEHTNLGKAWDTITWIISFAGESRPNFEAGDSDLIRLDLDSSNGGSPYVLVQKNPDESWYGEVLGRKPGYARAWWTEEGLLAVQLTRGQISGGRLARRAHWTLTVKRNPRTQEEADRCASDPDMPCVDTLSDRHRWPKN